MLFNSLDFAVFLPIVFVLYWFVTARHLKLQNILLLVASYVFYGWWDWRFLSLILFSSLVDYFVALAMSRSDDPRRRKGLLWISVLVNIGFLGFFKYFNFFVASFTDAFTLFGMPMQGYSLSIILPVGISFYTFQTLSYTIDVYRRKLEPTRDFIAFSAFVSFFPQLVAGPIERAKNLLPQFYVKRKFDYAEATEGLKQILWGLFKKMVIADNCAVFVNVVFEDYASHNASTLLLAAVFFAFQIYGDFSGYSDIAIGTSRLFGFRLMQNFAYPYFSRDIAEFWRRWHISLSTWFRDYVYIPLGGSRGPTYKQLRNVFIVFVVSGFWHGANWTFIFWGGLNALYFVPLLLLKRNRSNLDVVAAHRWYPSLRELWGMLTTFGITVLAWIFFRSETVGDAFRYIISLFDASLFRAIDVKINISLQLLFYLIAFMLLVEWLGRRKEFALSQMAPKWPQLVRWTFYAFIVFCILMYMQTEETPFIYFQF